MLSNNSHVTLKSGRPNAELPGLLFGKHHPCDVILSELWLFSNVLSNKTLTAQQANAPEFQEAHQNDKNKYFNCSHVALTNLVDNLSDALTMLLLDL